MANPAELLPGAADGVAALVKAVSRGGVPKATLELVHLRASQINGCSACIHQGVAAAKKAGETDERLGLVAAWREAPFFSDAERAALALTEAVTRVADRSGDAVSDEVWEAAAEHFDDEQLAALTLMIALTNMFNRINAAIREPAGRTWG
ncbi:carboxymuconolactone decarboxylase family protein [Nocardiopsis potens]|uniref:carboxymuconolactone decarboxylase family protein n=1 Tax=Nocardiopsis potens TaxID=1246458 RepID=UPI00035D82AD